MSFIEKLGHGGDLLTAAEAFNMPAEHFIDFSANINPLGPPMGVMNAIKNNLHHIFHYPDPSYRLLRKELAYKHHVEPEWVLVGNGAAECMSLVLSAWKPKQVGVVYPCFSEYESLCSAFDIHVKGCTGEEKSNFAPNQLEIAELIETSDVVFIGHPNNPNGFVYSMNELLYFAEISKQEHTTLIIDEAFIDFIPKNERISLIDRIADFPHVIIIRSMTKFYSIPGLRLGYTIAHPDIIRKLQKKQVTWSVNQLALTAGLACLSETDFEDKTIALITEERTFLKENIEKLGIFVFPNQVNFLLCRLPEGMHADQFQRQLGRKGILIRSCSMYKGLTERDFRIAVRGREENSALIAVMGNVIGDMKQSV